MQGVGFRPAVYRIARSLGLSGVVYNDTKGVTIELQGEQEKIAEFLVRLRSGPDKPPLAEIESCRITDIPLVEAEDEFVIRPAPASSDASRGGGSSDSQGSPLSQVTADIAACPDCLGEMADKEDFRHGYPFINCTNCGPRYSIVRTIPYDRPNTTMSVFEMCDRCAAQYMDVTDRRFHAQPVACAACGPKVRLTDNAGKTLATQTEAVIAEAVRLLLAGGIVAVKGIGGFHLAADALNETAVQRLRERKKRDHKPFAMMADSLEKIKKYAIVSEPAERVLKSPESPIVLLPKKAGSIIAASVAEGVDTYGFMLCYAPLHYLLFARGIEVLVMTSGNISDEPLICANEEALEKLGSVADVFLMHEREIYRQVDDSIVHLVEDQPVLLRRARGYVPTPVFTQRNCRRDIFAAGADLKNTFCFAKQNQLICSEHIGDLEDAQVYHHYVGSIEHLRRLFEIEPKVVACDLHPAYLSTQYALSMPEVEVVQVQHHWAHIASVLAEHGLDGPVIGLVCDGTGYGTDGAIWGCECMIASLEKFERFGHLAYYPLAGADKASKEAVRPLLSLLKKAYGHEFTLQRFDWFLGRIGTTCHSCEGRNPETKKVIDSRLRENDKMEYIRVISEQIEKGVNCVETSSLGRVFDAVAAMLGLGAYNYFDAHLPMALEAIAAGDVEDSYDFELVRTAGGPIQLDLSIMLKQLVADLQKGQTAGVVSAKFHNTVATGLLKMAEAAREDTKLDVAALGGGVFCNRYLANCLIKLLKKAGFSVLFNHAVPSNDGGVSLGQAAVAVRLVGGE